MHQQVFSLAGQRALITGGSSGIGLGIARGMAAAGAALVLLGRREEALEEARASLADAPVHTVAYDVSDLDGIEPCVGRILDEVGPLDILVNSAGMPCRGPAHEISMADWRQTLSVNLSAVFAFSRAFARARIAAKEPGAVINIASLMSAATRPGTSPYTASKGGVRSLTQALALDWASYGIRVNAIAPGYIRTSLTQVLQEEPEFDAWVKHRTPLGRWGTPEDLAPMAVFLAADGARFITGQTFYVDGGWLASF